MKFSSSSELFYADDDQRAPLDCITLTPSELEDALSVGAGSTFAVVNSSAPESYDYSGGWATSYGDQ